MKCQRQSYNNIGHKPGTWGWRCVNLSQREGQGLDNIHWTTTMPLIWTALIWSYEEPMTEQWIQVTNPELEPCVVFMYLGQQVQGRVVGDEPAIHELTERPEICRRCARTPRNLPYHLFCKSPRTCITLNPKPLCETNHISIILQQILQINILQPI